VRCACTSAASAAPPRRECVYCLVTCARSLTQNQEIVLTGGGSASAAVAQVVADVFQAPVLVGALCSLMSAAMPRC
jgi:sugar (pentulose or hexulose) kinase